ncbi:hypothetical protein [Enterococcus sp.]|uniref:hypothetical protein n=1 Tax=Enterococcus sp. TaxID=35783 RepID=UPI0025B9DA77|nr:hypothetical protein [Enterococcus sp.]
MGNDDCCQKRTDGNNCRYDPYQPKSKLSVAKTFDFGIKLPHFCGTNDSQKPCEKISPTKIAQFDLFKVNPFILYSSEILAVLFEKGCFLLSAQSIDEAEVGRKCYDTRDEKLRFSCRKSFFFKANYARIEKS